MPRALDTRAPDEHRDGAAEPAAAEVPTPPGPSGILWLQRAAAALAGGLASLVLAAPAAALAPPELFVRLQGEASEPVSDWMPLASGPALAWLGRYEIGYRLPQDGFQRVALTVTGVPAGLPTQPYAATP